MNYRWDKKYLYWGVTVICVMLAGFVTFAIIFKFQEILNVASFLFRMFTPIWYGFAVAYLLTPLVNKLDRIQMKTYLKYMKKTQRAKKVARVISVTVSILLLFGIITGLLLLLIPQLITNIFGFYENMESYFDRLQSWVANLLGENHPFAVYAEQFVIRIKETIEKWLSTDLTLQMQNLLQYITTTTWLIIKSITNIIIGIIISIYFLYSKEKFCAQGKKMTYALLNRRRSDTVIKNARYMHRVFGGFMTGKLVESTIVGSICFVAMTLFRFPYPTLISVAIGITNIIPFFGLYIGAVPGAILVFLAEPTQVLYFCIFIIILHQVEGNIIAPGILGEATGLNGFWVIFSALVFGGIFGVVGFIIGVPVFAVICTWIRSGVTQRLKSKHMPTETIAYYLPGCYRPMTDEENIRFQKWEHEETIEAFRKATKKTWLYKMKKWWKLRKYQ